MSDPVVHFPARDGPDAALAALLTPLLAPVFRRPRDTSGWGHGPFVQWLVHAARPQQIGLAGMPGCGTRALREAAAGFGAPCVSGEASVDLLLIEAPRDATATLAAWQGLLSPCAVVLLHGPGTAALFATLSARHPAFSFPHANGLGVVSVGAAAPRPVAWLCRLRDAAEIATCRHRFALLGDAWESAGLLHRLAAAEAAVASLRRQVDQMRG